MPYYATITEDLKRAKAILAEGKAGKQPDWMTDHQWEQISGGTIYGKDISAAYKLLESFVAELEWQRSRESRSPQREFRFDTNGSLDDVVIEKVELIHLERMGPSYWWMGVYPVTGESLVFHIMGTGDEVCVTVETD